MKKLFALVALCAALIAPLESARAAEPLVVCAYPDAMPRTGRAEDGSPRGVDLAVMQLVCKHLGRKMEVHWCGAAGNCYWHNLGEKECDVVVGQPLDSGPTLQVSWSIPYSGSRFGLVVPRNAQKVQSLADLAGKRVGIVAGTLPAASRKYRSVEFSSRESLLRQVIPRQLDAAFVDADFSSWYLKSHPELSLQLASGFMPAERWNMALAVRQEDRDLLAGIDRSLRSIMQSNGIVQVFSEEGLSYHAPFEKEKKPKRTSTLVDRSWERVLESGELVVSMDPANLPYSSAKEEVPGFDVELALALARELGLKARMNWLDIHRETSVGSLVEGDCDLAMGIPLDANAIDDEVELSSKKLVYSQPYYGTGYLIVARKGGPRIGKVSEMEKGKSNRIGAEAGSIADYRLRQRGYHRRLFRTQLSVLKSIHDRGIDFGYLWSNVGWTMHASPDLEVELIPDYVPVDRWNIAIAMRREDEQLLRRINSALSAILSRGEVTAALDRYHVPHHPVFLEPASPKPSAGAQPKQKKRPESKGRYSTLSRIRARGLLTVGLDQNNRPFSTAHPEPAGLEYEIAGVLAEQLGVSRKVYWAYSSHDSYPSKLVKKKDCDIVLGVMPDDRFSDRVAYSKPYALAGYRFVVRSAGESPTTLEQLIGKRVAIEPGVAVRGLAGWKTKPLANLDEILRAVANQEVEAGYVISRKAHWLAEKKWPGKLRFLDNRAPADQFPICVALRKEDKDLLAAINLALEDLAQSGKMAEVFERWNIPYNSVRPLAQSSQ